MKTKQTVCTVVVEANFPLVEKHLEGDLSSTGDLQPSATISAVWTRVLEDIPLSESSKIDIAVLLERVNMVLRSKIRSQIKHLIKLITYI